jgi:putative heme-binding domain-containing protein
VQLQTAAVETLASFDHPGVAEALLANWPAYSPEARSKVLQSLLNRRERAPALLAALEQGRIEPSAVDAVARARFLNHPDSAVVERARKLFERNTTERAKVVQAYLDVLQMKGDVQSGKKVFQENCARCHMPRRLGGQRVGSDLSGINNKTKAELLTSILNPSYAIEDRFVNYIVTTKDGQIHDGILANETPGAITLRGGLEEGDETILRKNIAEIRASKISLMPDDFEKLGKQSLADVIAYLRGGL